MPSSMDAENFSHEKPLLANYDFVQSHLDVALLFKPS